jgi:hypothetical protein
MVGVQTITFESSDHYSSNSVTQRIIHEKVLCKLVSVRCTVGGSPACCMFMYICDFLGVTYDALGKSHAADLRVEVTASNSRLSR